MAVLFCGRQPPIFISSKLPIHPNVKHHVHIDMFISMSIFSFPRPIRCNAVKFFKWYIDIFHFFYYCIGPKLSHRLSVNLICLFYCLCEPYPKLIWYAPILGCYPGKILSWRRKVSLTHQLKSGSSLISFTMEYSASSTGLDCLRSSIETQSTYTSFHSTNIFQTWAVPFHYGFPLL